MPLPLILGIAAGIAAVAGVGSGIHGGVKMKEANDTMKSAQSQHEDNIKRFETENKRTTSAMDSLGKYELETMKQFKTFSDIFEKIQNRPEFKSININDVKLPEYNAEELSKVSVGAGVVLGGIGGAAAGTLGGIAAGGATTAAVMTFGTASTGTAIATLSCAAATNATLAALGGGSIAAGGLGIGAGTMVLGGATLGVGLLVGGVIFNVTGCKLSEKADEAWAQMKKAEEQINKICNYLTELCRTAKSYYNSLKKVNNIYSNHLEKMRKIVDEEHRVDWYEYNDEEQKMIENTTLLTQLLYSMCKVQLVLKTKDKNGINKVNSKEVIKSQQNANTVLRERGLAAITPQQYSGAMKAGVISLLPFTGANKDAVAYMINHRTGMNVDQARLLLTNGGKISTDDVKSLADDLRSYGMDITIE